MRVTHDLRARRKPGESTLRGNTENEKGKDTCKDATLATFKLSNGANGSCLPLPSTGRGVENGPLAEHAFACG